jgi:hypothetical protein
VKVSNELNHTIHQLPDGVQKMGMVFFSNPEPCRDEPEPCRNDLNYSAAIFKKGSMSRTESMMGSFSLCRDVPRSCRDGNLIEKEKKLSGY